VLRRSPNIANHPQCTEGFNEKNGWGSLFRPSLQYLLIEHGFRLASDRYARDLLFHKPFWEDWAISILHFDMSPGS
jgi:hypothetical protein